MTFDGDINTVTCHWSCHMSH